MLLAYGQDPVQIGRQSEDMYRKNGGGTIVDLFFNLLWIDGESFRIRIGKYRQRFLIEDHIVGGNEGIRRDNNLIAGIDSQGVQCSDQGSGAAGGGNDPFGSDEFSIIILKLLAFVPIAPVPVSTPE